MVYDATDRLGDFFTSRRERGIADLPTLSVTLTNGLVPRDTLDRKMETNLSDEEHLLVRKDDIVYNMMRMWQGASGLSDRDGLLSPAYVVLAPKKGIDPLYASYLFKSSRLIYLFWAYSYGLTGDRLRLYFNDFKSIPVNIPPLPEQIMIGHILSTWDKAIEKLEALIAAKQKRKTALMQQLLTGSIRFSGFDREWKEISLGTVCSPQQWPTISSKDLIESGYPVYGANGFIGYFSNYNHMTETVAVTCRGSTCGEVTLIPAMSYITGNSMCLDDIDASKHDYKFIYYALCGRGFLDIISGSAQPQIVGSAIRKIKFVVPPLDEQQKITTILSAADNEITTHKNQLAALKKQKKGLMQQLLTGKKRVNINQAAA